MEEGKPEAEDVTSGLDGEKAEVVTSEMEGEKAEDVASGIDGEKVEDISRVMDGEEAEDVTSETDEEKVEDVTSETDGEKVEDVTSETDEEKVEDVTSETDGEEVEYVTSEMDEEAENVSSGMDGEKANLKAEEVTFKIDENNRKPNAKKVTSGIDGIKAKLKAKKFTSRMSQKNLKPKASTDRKGGRKPRPKTLMDKAMEKVLDEFIQTRILDVCFDVHRALKFGYFCHEEYLTRGELAELVPATTTGRPSKEEEKAEFQTFFQTKIKKTHVLCTCVNCIKKKGGKHLIPLYTKHLLEMYCPKDKPRRKAAQSANEVFGATDKQEAILEAMQDPEDGAGVGMSSEMNVKRKRKEPPFYEIPIKPPVEKKSSLLPPAEPDIWADFPPVEFCEKIWIEESNQKFNEELALSIASLENFCFKEKSSAQSAFPTASKKQASKKGKNRLAKRLVRTASEDQASEQGDNSSERILVPTTSESEASEKGNESPSAIPASEQSTSYIQAYPGKQKLHKTGENSDEQSALPTTSKQQASKIEKSSDEQSAFPTAKNTQASKKEYSGIRIMDPTASKNQTSEKESSTYPSTGHFKILINTINQEVKIIETSSDQFAPPTEQFASSTEQFGPSTEQLTDSTASLSIQEKRKLLCATGQLSFPTVHCKEQIYTLPTFPAEQEEEEDDDDYSDTLSTSLFFPTERQSKLLLIKQMETEKNIPEKEFTSSIPSIEAFTIPTASMSQGTVSGSGRKNQEDDEEKLRIKRVKGKVIRRGIPKVKVKVRREFFLPEVEEVEKKDDVCNFDVDHVPENL